MEEESLAVGVRDSVKRIVRVCKSDFVLWFTKSKFDDQELKWTSWGGLPGWHIECSGISISTSANTSTFTAAASITRVSAPHE